MVELGNKRKGVGYIIEGFVSVLVIFVFVLGPYAHNPDQFDITPSQDRVSGRDLTYVLQKNSDLQKYLKEGRTGSLRTTIEGVTGGKLQASGTIDNLPDYEPTIGVYTPDIQIYKESLDKVKSGDPCHGDLQEINSSNEPGRVILKTEGTLTSSVHQKTIYLADTDARKAGGFNGEKDYDAIWVDRGRECQFSEEEGPHLMENIFFWGEEDDSLPDHYYDLKNIDSDNMEMTVYRADLTQKLKRKMNQPVNGMEIEPNMDKFNFTDQLNTYDLLVFHKSRTLAGVNSNQDKLLNYLEDDGSALFMMNLTGNNLQTGFLSKTGLKWIDLPRNGVNSNFNDAAFNNFRDSRSVETYYDGIRSTGSLSHRPQGKISSGGKYYTTENQLVTLERGSTGSPQEYDTAKWDATNDSMSTTSPPSAAPPSCTGDYYEADFIFHKEGGTEVITGYKTTLGSPLCNNNPESITIDHDQDGSYSTFLEGEEITVENKRYKVNFKSSDNDYASFNFSGVDKVELVNYRDSFENRDIGRFARMSNISETDTGSDLKLATSVMYWLIEEEQEFGSSSIDSTAMTTTSGGFKENTYQPYKVFMRWSR